MTKEHFDKLDPAFLISRSLDEKLAPDQRARLSEALASSQQVQSEQRDLAAVHDLVRRWAGEPIELDWDAFGALIQERIAQDTDDDAERNLGETLRRWKDATVYDADDLEATVMARVRQDAGRPRRARRILRIAAPFAAAAVIALAWLGGFPAPRSDRSEPICVVTIRPSGAAYADAGPTGAPRCVVRFLRERSTLPGPSPSDAGDEKPARSPGISFTVVGMASTYLGFGEVTP